jgi:hypothetical protein
MKLDYRIRAHANLSRHPNNSHPTTTKATPSAPHTMSHPSSTDSGNYGVAPMDLSAAKKSQNQRRRDKRMAKASAFIVDWRTILRTNTPCWPATMPGRFVWQPWAYPPPTWTPFTPLPRTREKSSPSAARWLCWWTHPGVFIRFCSGSFICIC